MFMAFFKKIEDDVNIAFIEFFVLYHIKKYLLSFGDDFRMIISSVDLLKKALFDYKFFNCILPRLRRTIRASSANFAKQFDCIQLFLRDLAGNEHTYDSNF
jgi:hypothetical protein